MSRRWFARLALCSLLIACAPTQHILYDLSDVAPAAAPRVNVVLRLRDFDDGRARDAPSLVLLDDANGNEARIDGKRRCLNGERYYQSGAVTREVAEMIAAHLSRRGVIRHVHGSSAAAADYSLRGEVHALYGMQDFHWGSAIGAQFGLIGALSTMGNQSQTQIRIELTKLTLFDAKDRVVAVLPRVLVELDGPMPVDAYCWAIYANVNEQLKVAVGRLADWVEATLAHASNGSR